MQPERQTAQKDASDPGFLQPDPVKLRTMTGFLGKCKPSDIAQRFTVQSRWPSENKTVLSYKVSLMMMTRTMMLSRPTPITAAALARTHSHSGWRGTGHRRFVSTAAWRKKGRITQTHICQGIIFSRGYVLTNPKSPFWGNSQTARQNIPTACDSWGKKHTPCVWQTFYHSVYCC